MYCMFGSILYMEPILVMCYPANVCSYALMQIVLKSLLGGVVEDASKLIFKLLVEQHLTT